MTQMSNKNIHVSDEDILLLADGELASHRASQVRAHLESCWGCRTRMSEMEGTIADFVRTHHCSLDPQLPSDAGSRALLKARLAEAAGTRPGTSWFGRLQFGFSQLVLLYSSAALLLFVVGWTVIRLNSHLPPKTRLVSFKSEPIPDSLLTPGATRPVMRADICSAGYREMNRAVSPAVQQEVFHKYGIAGARVEDYEVDYLVTPELGGSDDIRNLWPEPYAVTAWDAHVKDALEDRLHQMVCEGKIDLSTAQYEMASDWISAYKKYFNTDKPLAVDSSTPPVKPTEGHSQSELGSST